MLANILLKFISTDTLCTLLAKIIAKLLNAASRKGGKAWDNSKAVLKKASVWIDLFNEVYEDDELTAEEEQKIADAIKNETSIEKITEILKK